MLKLKVGTRNVGSKFCLGVDGRALFECCSGMWKKSVGQEETTPTQGRSTNRNTDSAESELVA